MSDIGDQGLLVVLKAKDGLKVLLTLEKSIVSFEYSVNANLFPKYELFVNVDRRSLSTHN